MASERRKSSARREPVFDATPIVGGNLRFDASERIGGPPEDDASRPRARDRRASNDDGRTAVRGRAKSSPKKGKTKRRRGGGGSGRSLLGRLVYWAAILCVWGLIAVGAVLGWVAAHLPPIQSLEVPKRPPSITIVGLDGSTLATRGEMGGAAVPLAALPKYLPQAFIAIEDRRFYQHFGIDVIGTVRAAAANLMHRGVSQGGSTLTQQLAKNLFLTQERTFSRKLQEVVLAFWLEHKFSKKQILELYLNRVYFGSGAYGVEGAAQRYFGKSARNVTLAEAAMLAGLVKSPSKLAPTRNLEGATRRAELVLAAMADAGFISQAQALAATADPVQAVKATNASGANYVADWVADTLDDLIGHVEQDVIVETTIDPNLQAAAEKAVTDELAAKGAKFGVTQGALVSMSPDGAVRALVGGRNYAESQFNRAVTAKRQPGSAFKPFVYLAALERGLTPETLREDRPIDVKGWRPENYSRDYHGAVPLTYALAHSLNTVSVRLTMEVGPKAVVQVARRLGIGSKLDANASIALGTSEVSVLELTSAYVPFANGGISVAPHVVSKVTATNGRVLYQSRGPFLGRAMDVRYAGMMNAMMRETLVSGTAKKAELPPGWVGAGKTGTSQDFRDAWFVGYTGYLVTTVWLGNDDNSPAKKSTGGGLPVDIWSQVMKVALQNVAPVELPGYVAPMAGGFAAPGSMAPPASVPSGHPSAPVADPRRAPPQQSRGLDDWLMDTLFGRR
jgi:penicillin-binding protein 1A